jgi:hypothetical protein
MSNQQDVIEELLNSVREKDSDNEDEKIYGEEHLTQLRTACDMRKLQRRSQAIPRKISQYKR